MRVFFTRNVNKEIQFVNGMGATVEAWDEKSKAVRVITDSGNRVAVFLFTDREMGNLVYYPLREGYASTVIKYIGAELPHLVLWLDKPHVPGAAYTGMSRVKFGENCLIGGNVTAAHFQPVL